VIHWATFHAVLYSKQIKERVGPFQWQKVVLEVEIDVLGALRVT